VAPNRSGSGLGRTVKAALTGLVTKAATDYLQGRFGPRYTGQYDENRHEWDV
jgi:hypothetical protein